MTTNRACIYFDSDQSVTVLAKNRCILRGPFIKGAEVEVDWRGEDGRKQRHIGLIIATKEKDKELLEKYSKYVSLEIDKWVNEGKTPKEEFHLLKPLENFDISTPDTSKDFEEKKRKRKPTQLMKDSLEQEKENEGESKKKHRKVNLEESTVPSKKPKGVSSCAKKTEPDKKRQKEKPDSKNAEKHSSIEASKEMLNCMGALSQNFPVLATSIKDGQQSARSKQVSQELDDSGCYLEISDDEDNTSPISQSTESMYREENPVLLELDPHQTIANPQHSMKSREIADVIADAMKTVHDFAISEGYNESRPMESCNNCADLLNQKRALEEENKLLREEIERLKGNQETRTSTTTTIPVPSVEVLNYFQAILSQYQEKSLLDSDPKPIGQYTIQANLSPPQTTVKSETKIKLLAEYDVSVDREKLRSLLHSSNSKGPIHLLGRLVSLVFTQEELAQSCGQGLHKTSSTEKPPLNATKLSACKEYMTAFCIKHGKQVPSPKDVNMAITAQVTYARVKSNGRSKNVVKIKN